MFGVAICCLLAGVLCSCQKSATSGNYYEVIPATSKFICAVNVNQLITKGDVSQQVEARMTGLLGKDMDMDAAALEKVQQILKNGNESGLDFSDYVFGFTGSEQENIAIVAKVTDISKLKAVFDCIGQQKGCTPLTAQGDYHQTVLDGNMVCTFNSELILCMVSKNVDYSKEYSLRLLNKKEIRSIVSNPCFQKMLEGKSDFELLSSMENLPEAVKANMAVYTAQMSFDITKMYVIGSLNFEEGKVSLKYELTATDPAIITAMREQVDYMSKISDRFLTYYPASTLLYMIYSCNGVRMNEMLDKNNLWKYIPADQAETEKIIASLDGDIACGITGLSVMGMPNVLAYAQVKDTYLADCLAGLVKGKMGQTGVLKDKGNHNYEFNVQMINMNFYFGVKNGNLFYLTNDQEAYANLGKAVKDPFSSSAMVSDIKGTLGGIILNIESLLQSPIVSLSLYQMVGQQQGALMQKVLSEFSYTELLNVTETGVVWNLYLKNKQQNSLKTLIDLGNELSALK